MALGFAAETAAAIANCVFKPLVSLSMQTSIKTPLLVCWIHRSLPIAHTAESCGVQPLIAGAATALQLV
jgi:hypothetical protein